MVRVLITEAHDGLGLALVKEYLTDTDNQVIAFCGDSAKHDDLNTLKATHDTQLLIVDVDLVDEDSIKASVKPIEEFVDSLDLLIFNTGFIPDAYVNKRTNEPNKEQIRTYMPKLAFAPRWLKENIFPLLKLGQESRCIGMSPYMSRVNTIETIQNLKTKGNQFIQTSHHMFGVFAKGIDPKQITVIDLWLLAETIVRRGELDNPLLQIVDAMNMIEVANQDAVDNKAKNLYANIPRLPHGKHYVGLYKYPHLLYI